MNTFLYRLAESFLKEHYTTFARKPSDVLDSYCPDAELIYTGQKLNVDAVYASGIVSIADFLKSETANRFKGARVVVEALHPQMSPVGFFCLTLFAKGKIWFPSVGGGYVCTPFVHFFLLVPEPRQRWGTGEGPSMRIANEYCHLSDVPLQPSMAPAMEVMEKPAPEVMRRVEDRQTEGRSSFVERRPDRRSELRLHCSPLVEATEAEVLQIVNKAVERNGGGANRCCVSCTIENPKGDYFFIYVDDSTSFQKVLSLRQVEIGGRTVRISPPRTSSSHRGNGFGAPSSSNVHRGNAWMQRSQSNQTQAVVDATMSTTVATTSKEIGGSTDAGTTTKVATNGGAPSARTGSNSFRGSNSKPSSTTAAGANGNNFNGNRSFFKDTKPGRGGAGGGRARGGSGANDSTTAKPAVYRKAVAPQPTSKEPAATAV